MSVSLLTLEESLETVETELRSLSPVMSMVSSGKASADSTAGGIWRDPISLACNDLKHVKPGVACDGYPMHTDRTEDTILPLLLFLHILLTEIPQLGEPLGVHFDLTQLLLQVQGTEDDVKRSRQKTRLRWVTSDSVRLPYSESTNNGNHVYTQCCTWQPRPLNSVMSLHTSHTVQSSVHQKRRSRRPTKVPNVDHCRVSRLIW